MDFSEIMNIILSGGLVGTAAAIGSLRATVRKAKAEAMKAEADAECNKKRPAGQQARNGAAAQSH